jgi:hypothetical protein
MHRSHAWLALSSLVLSLAGCGDGTTSPDAGRVEALDTGVNEVDAASALDAFVEGAPDAFSREDAPGPDAGTILPTYDGGDPFSDDSGLGDPAWVDVDVLTDGTTCPPLLACGGDVVGTWDVTGACFELPIEDELSRCPGAAITRREGRARGRVTFDGAFARRVAQSEVLVEITVPAVCAAVVPCATIESTLRSGGAPDSACVSEASGACRCAARQVTAIDDADGYRIEGNQIVSATLGRRWDYCIEGTSLRYQDVTPGATSREPGIIQLGRR